EGFESDPDLDWIAAGLEAAMTRDARPSSSLEARLHSEAATFETDGSGEKTEIAVPFPAFWKHPALGWAVAACLAIGLFVFRGGEESLISPERQRQALIETADVLELPFAGTPGFSELEGDVVWQDDRQEGYLRFTGLAANDPREKQYQLWIVDPERDSKPVDGGVFDIPATAGPVVVPIRAALPVDGPTAFVVTVEKPGGVVVSLQEEVAAIAQQG
ncbi:MAG: anti-sigma factor, partial [Verrucomicrobiota bacterium]